MTVTLINEIPIGIRFKPDSGLPSGCFKEEELLEHMNVTLPKKVMFHRSNTASHTAQKPSQR